MKKILWDIDGTLLNFNLAETYAINECFKKHGLSKPSEEMVKDYKIINDSYWKKLERGEVSREKVLVGRFEDFFDKYKIKASASDFNKDFQIELGRTYAFNPRGAEVIRKLSKDYDQYAVTNGSLTAQEGKLQRSGLADIFIYSFISELVGYEKPDQRFFDEVFDKIGSRSKDDYAIIGDSLTSDMQGGINVGIKTIWYNPDKMDNYLSLPIDYEVETLAQIPHFLEKIFA